MNKKRLTTLLPFIIGVIIIAGTLVYGISNKPDENLGASLLYPQYGGTGTSTKPTFGKILVGNAGGTYTLTATSSLGITAAIGALDSISDVALVAAAYGDLLMFDGSNWVDRATSTLGISGGSMTYPGAGIALSTGSGWDTSIADASANWNTAYGWGNHAGLYDVLGQATGSIAVHNAAYNHANFNTAYGWGNHAGLYDVLGQATGTLAVHNAAYNHANFLTSVASDATWTLHNSYPTACATGVVTGIGDTLTCTATSTLNIDLANTVGTLTVAKGGTGQITFTAGQLLYGNGTNALSSVATTTLTGTAPIVFSQPIYVLGASASAVSCNAASISAAGCLSAANWNTFNNKWDLASSTIPLNKGGTGLTTLTGAGRLLYSGVGGSSISTLASSTYGTVLWIGADGYPAWTATSTLGLGGGGAQTPWTSNIAGAGYNLTGVGVASSTSFITQSGTSTSAFVVGLDGAAKPGCLAIQDNDSAGWTYCYTLNGTMTCSTTDCSGTGTSTLKIGR
jgi:hypothetical protein